MPTPETRDTDRPRGFTRRSAGLTGVISVSILVAVIVSRAVAAMWTGSATTVALHGVPPAAVVQAGLRIEPPNDRATITRERALEILERTLPSREFTQVSLARVTLQDSGLNCLCWVVVQVPQVGGISLPGPGGGIPATYRSIIWLVDAGTGREYGGTPVDRIT